MSDVEIDLALSQVQAMAYRKKINASSWNDNYEDLISQWGEKAAALRFMHNNSARYWRRISNNLGIYSILATTVASAASLVGGSIDDSNAKDVVLFTAGGIGLVTSCVQSLKKFYNAEEKAAEHASIAKQFGAFYRYIILQMGMSREDRIPSDELSDWALKEYERLQQGALQLRDEDVKLYKKNFSKSTGALPDICSNDLSIPIYGRTYSIDQN